MASTCCSLWGRGARNSAPNERMDTVRRRHGVSAVRARPPGVSVFCVSFYFSALSPIFRGYATCYILLFCRSAARAPTPFPRDMALTRTGIVYACISASFLAVRHTYVACSPGWHWALRTRSYLPRFVDVLRTHSSRRRPRVALFCQFSFSASFLIPHSFFLLLLLSWCRALARRNPFVRSRGNDALHPRALTCIFYSARGYAGLSCVCAQELWDVC
ncbi:hypothetical protein C8F04DRAFT_705117 [Mycena alexandri]|uniref:Uncharacterized protein n=1 Tax=Mycena alexandri TaxID=1745969 RepID=A0AAD6WY65_9AGAR|nr:hypothetical protein C8F04DRAFT_1117693 [Mycena alexandri]KAJ7031203.1 hypothetical protein C8F04DRAFT_705117 [Mycena alexandri]